MNYIVTLPNFRLKFKMVSNILSELYNLFMNIHPRMQEYMQAKWLDYMLMLV